jgi:hypothetical protein
MLTVSSISLLSSVFCLQAIFRQRWSKFSANGYVLAMVGHLTKVSPTFAQMPDRSTSVEFTTVSPTIANTMLAVRAFVIFENLI